MLGKGEIIIFRVTTLLNSNVQFLLTKKIIKHTNKWEIWPIQDKKLSQQKTVPAKDLMVDLLDKDFKNNGLKDPQRTKDVKIKKMMCEQNGYVNK